MRMRRASFPPSVFLAAALAGLLLIVPAGCNRSGGNMRSGAQVRLNEVMAANNPRSGIAVPDEVDNPVYADWVELHNPGISPVSLTGYSLSDRRDNPDKYEFPPGTVMAAGSYLIVFFYSKESCEDNAREQHGRCREEQSGDPAQLLECDEDLKEDLATCIRPAGYVADFNISGSSDTLFLFADAGRFLVDQVGVRMQGAALANGIDPVTHELGVIYEPTPRAMNPPVNIKPHVVSVLAFPAACEQETEVRLAVDRDVAAPGELVVMLEYADVDAPSQIEDATFSSVPVVRYSPQEGDPPPDNDPRVDVHGNEITVEREQRSYMGFIPAGAAACGKIRAYRVTAVDPVATVRYSNHFICCQELATLVVNEYQPKNSRNGFVFTYKTPEEEVRTVDPDWIEIYNYGETTASITHIGLVTGGDYDDYVAASVDEQPIMRAAWWRFGTQSGSAEDVEVSLPAGAYLWVLADSDGGEFRRAYHLEGGDPERIYYSTNFALDPTPDAPGEFDGFVLVDTTTGAALDRVILDFRDNGNDLEQDKSAGRFEKEGTIPNALQPGTITDCPTPEAPNIRTCDIAPLFRRELQILSAAEKPFPDRCPPAGAAVTVRTRVNVDSDIPIADIAASLSYQVGGGVETAVPATLAEGDPTQAAPASKLYDVKAEIPAQVTGALVEFKLVVQATDRSKPGQPTVTTAELTQQGETDPLSFRYVQGFVEPVLSPAINEVLPGNSRTPVHPVFGDPPTDTPDFAEIHNPDPANELDLEGYFLTTTPTAASPIALPRLFRFPAGSIAPAGGFLVVYFGPPPEGEPPADYIQVTQFNLDDCSETLHLISPDDGPRGGNFRLDSLTWNLQRGDVVTECKLDTAVGRICESCAGDRCLVELNEPSPGVSNATKSTPPPVFYDASHVVFVPPDFPANIPVPPGQQVELKTVMFLDPRLRAAHGGTWRNAITEAAYLVEGAPQTEYVFAGALDTINPDLSCDEAVRPGCAPPEGYVAVAFAKRIQPPFSPVVRYRLRFTDACGNVFTTPESTFGTTAGQHPGVVINEINRASPVPGAAATRSWIELFNPTGAPVDLSGAFLSNDPNNPRRATLPPGTIIPAGGILLVLTDGSPLPPYVHAPLGWARVSPTVLSFTGDLFLLDSPDRGTCLLDDVSYDFTDLADGDSLGRNPDGAAGDLAKLFQPSPGAPNSGALTFIRGDATEDGKLNVSDMIRILAILFSGDSRRPACLDAMDADDSGVANLADPIYIGNFVFQQGTVIPPPFPAPGLDPTPDAVTACGS